MSITCAPFRRCMWHIRATSRHLLYSACTSDTAAVRVIGKNGLLGKQGNRETGKQGNRERGAV
jgi:hypothetical protein